jgi:hypothetical protein
MLFSDNEGREAHIGRNRMHRVRVGLIGLAWVFLLVMLATTFLHVAGGDRSANNAATANDTAPSEPLAELGVAPGNTPPETASVPPQAKPVAPTN